MWKYIALFFCIGLCSCSHVRYLSMESLCPAELSFPTHVKSVGVVDNVVFHDTLLAKGITLGVMEGDGRIMAHRLAVGLADADYFDEVILCDSSLRAHEWMNTPVELSQEKSARLLADLGVDMLVVMDGMAIQTSCDKVDEILTEISGELSAAASVYLPSSESRKIRRIDVGVKDKYSWVLNPALTEELMVQESSEYVAALLLDYLVPQWKLEERFYYAGGEVAMRDAAICIQEQDWDGAGQLWKSAYEGAKPKSKKRMRAALNMALYQEMQGNIAQALKYVDEAISLTKPKSYDRNNITFYKLKLEPKLMKNKKLNLQMERFDKK